ncbi:MAG: hypothetical protein NC924_09075 [Candidatus Omnitrophica bacterium]|nr:hypothetical protein [Candidatus Omnitrophota bacterium]
MRLITSTAIAILAAVSCATAGYAANQMVPDVYNFTVLADLGAPYLAASLPAVNAADVSRTAALQLTIKDDLSGVDSSTIDINVAGETIVAGGVAQTYVNSDGNAVAYSVEIREQSPRECVVLYYPSDYFKYQQTVPVSVQVEDRKNNESGALSYSFVTQRFMRSRSMQLLPFTVRAYSEDYEQQNPVVVTYAGGKMVCVVWEQVINGQGGIYSAVSADFGQTFSMFRKISDVEAGLDCRNPAAVADAQGNIYVVWDQRAAAGTADIYISRLPAGDTDFSRPSIVYNDNGLANQTLPAVAAGPALTQDADSQTIEPASVYVAWIDDQGGAATVRYTRTTAAYQDAWNTFVSVPLRVDATRSGQVPQAVSIDVSSTGSIACVWSAKNTDGTSSVYMDWAAKTTIDGGEVFHTDTQVSGGTAGNRKPAVCISANATRLNVLWLEQINGREQLKFNDYRWTGSAYALSGRIYPVFDTAVTAGTIGNFMMSMDNRLDVFVAWSAFNGSVNQIHLAGATHHNYAFSLFAQEYVESNQRNPAVALSDAGAHYYVSWQEEGIDGHQVIYFERNSFIDTSETYEQTVDGDAGGTVVVPHGVLQGCSLQIPAGALAIPLRIFVAEVVEPPPMPRADVKIIGSVVDFGPGDTRFAQPVTITIPYAESNLAAQGRTEQDSFAVYYFNIKSEAWELVPGAFVDTVNNRVAVTTNHFSMYAIGVSPAGQSQSAPEATPSPAPTPTPTTPTPTVTNNDGGSGSGGCFIATAAFGTKMAPEVRVLSRFRDEYLLTNEWGKTFVHCYYTYSPTVADHIARSPSARSAVRWCLQPLLSLSKVLCGASAE